jgi:hypothetical protein
MTATNLSMTFFTNLVALVLAHEGCIPRLEDVDYSTMRAEQDPQSRYARRWDTANGFRELAYNGKVI